MLAMIMLASAVFAPVSDSKWQIDYGNDKCRLMRTFSNGQRSMIFGFTKLGSLSKSKDVMSIFFVLYDPGKTLPVWSRDAELRLQPNSLLMKGTESFKLLADHKTMGEVSVRGDPGPLSAISEIDLTAIPFILRIAPAVPPGGDDALQACSDDMLRSWGLDPAERDRIITSAKIIDPGEVFKTEDYPRRSDALHASGHVTMTATVGVNGVPSECRIAVSSGSTELDTTSCAIFTKRARFSPALDNANKPMVSHVIYNVNWNQPLIQRNGPCVSHLEENC